MYLYMSYNFIYVDGYGLKLSNDFVFYKLFNSPDPKDHVRYCYHLASVVVVCKLLNFNLFLKLEPFGSIFNRWSLKWCLFVIKLQIQTRDTMVSHIFNILWFHWVNGNQTRSWLHFYKYIWPIFCGFREKMIKGSQKGSPTNVTLSTQYFYKYVDLAFKYIILTFTVLIRFKVNIKNIPVLSV